MISNTNLSFKKLVSHLIPYLRELIAGGAFMLIYVCCWPVLAWLAGRLIPAIGKGDLQLVLNIITQALIIFLLQKTAQYIQDTILARPALKTSQKIRQDLFKKLQKIDIQSLEKLSTGDITYRLTEDADRVGEVIYKTVQDTIPCIFQLIAVITYMIYIDINLSIATLLLAPIITLLVGKFGEKVLITEEKSQQKISNLASLLSESIQVLPLIKAYGAENWLQQRFDNQVDIHRKAKYKALKQIALQHPVIGFIEALGILIVLAIGALRIQSGAIDGQGFSSYFAALLMLIDPISHLTTNFNELQQGQASLKRLREINRLPKEDNEENLLTANLNNGGEIEIKDVCFSYKNGDQVINNINLKIRSGEKIALVGPSGAGKSTIFSLLLKFIKPQNGKIYINGNDLSTVDSYQVRSKIAIVPQKMNILSGTILDSISFGRNYTKEEIITASKIANAHEFIMNMPSNYSTHIEERGTNLSGGQLQRISIARAILGNPSILLLDEATSALDAESEKSVQMALDQAMKNRTVLIIAHRLATTQEADKIIYIENGSIAETGQHDELMNKAGKYRELCEKQFIRDIKNINQTP
ncbi:MULTISPECIES: ABC transporter ATP-binding protein [unclassified Prochlorococcus]|uniref:ABC transporter ATP-binding protein n=1 Tax=unclassified Prochlorococcus TaxID=2627481 RepID=UPI000533A1D4|nr:MULTISPECIES: ABC transporter ATP-binding protein [unclassified Prochlorococcus]KGG15219.1 Lipid A export ATP-binding/permease protein MsbA [Prochlorococcus sp. MIT 0602]KGG17494.1 Lipid A export ATP-binding/permease protein MsbA [Prochlorococcus sp. MIT 0603]